MRRLLAAACACAVAFVAGVCAQSSMAEDSPPPPTTTTATEPETDIGDFLLGEIAKARRETWRWERLMRLPLTQARRVAERSNDREHRLLILKGWKQKAAKRRRQAQHPPFKSAWLCIYRHERHPRMGWRTLTGNGFYGGLQMDLAFQRIYGADLLRKKGTANRWTALEQIWVAVRAHRSGRGFYPWPNTARYCGLI
jgi:Transglycosylase-like domain